jgi:eukaryotic-like serine/threonine-protein kinase
MSAGSTGESLPPGAGLPGRVAAAEATSDSRPSAPRPDLPPVHPEPPSVPDHQLLRCIGRGSYGEVWLARNAMGSPRAVKIVYRDSFDSDRPYQREFEGIRKFEPVSHARESQVDIFHVGINEPAGYFYYIMELADDAAAGGQGNQCLAIGNQSDAPSLNTDHRSLKTASVPSAYVPRTLKVELRRRGPLPAADCIQIGLALTKALEHLHGHGLVHRDIKPSNIIFVQGVPKLADIGLVTSVDATRSFVGTEGYVSPEGPGTPQSDLYSLGKVLYEMAGGDREAFPEIPASWRERPDVVQLLELNEIIVKACDQIPSQRYLTAEKMHQELGLLERGRSIQRRRSWEQVGRVAERAGAVLAILALGGLVVAQLARRKALPSSALRPERASIFVLPFRNAETNLMELGFCNRVTDAFIDSRTPDIEP